LATEAVLDDVDFVEDEFLPADGLRERFLDCPSRCHKLDLLALVLHLEVAFELVLVQEFLYEALSVVLGQDLLDAGVHHQIDADAHDSHYAKRLLLYQRIAVSIITSILTYSYLFKCLD
jgi:hypothetical protein